MTDIIHFSLTLYIYLSCPYLQLDKHIKQVDTKTLLWVEESRRIGMDQQGLTRINKDQSWVILSDPWQSWSFEDYKGSTWTDKD